MKKSFVVSFLVVSTVLLDSASAQQQAPDPGLRVHPPPVVSARAPVTRLTTGIVGGDLFVRGRFAGRIEPSRINCLGHASGVGSSVQTGTLPLLDALSALGFSCRAGEPESLAGAISGGRRVMMVYLYAYPDKFRRPEDRAVLAVELAARYGWRDRPWEQKAVFSNDQGDLPFDYHAIGYDPARGEWEWVAHARPKEPDGSYVLDSIPGTAAALDPDRYFPDEFVIAKLACSSDR